MFPPKSPFRALFGAFYRHPAHRSALRAEGLRTSWHLVNVGAPPSPWPLFSRLPPHTAVRRHQRGQVMSRPFPAGYCLMPTPELGKSQRGPISTSDPSTLSMSPNQVIFTDKTICSPPLAAAHPLTVLSWPRRSTPVLPRGHEVVAWARNMGHLTAVLAHQLASVCDFFYVTIGTPHFTTPGTRDFPENS